MRWPHLLLIPALFIIVACQRGPAARPPWAAGANQALMGSSNTSISPGSANNVLLAVEDVHCGSGGDSVYLVDVAWVTTLDDADYARIEYEVKEGPFSGDVAAISEPQVAEEVALLETAGLLTFGIPDGEVKAQGDRILVRMLIGVGEDEIASPVDWYEVIHVCPGS